MPTITTHRHSITRAVYPSGWITVSQANPATERRYLYYTPAEALARYRKEFNLK